MEIKKCGRGLCGSVGWLRNSEQFARQVAARRQERERVPARPADHRPSALQQHAPDRTQHLGGERLQSRRGAHLHGRQADPRLEPANRAQRLQDVADVWREIWTRSTLPPDATPPQLIEVKAPAEPGQTEKAAPRSVPQPEAPMIEASLEREQLPAPGFTLVTNSANQQPLSGDDVLSMAMTGVAPVPTTVAPSPAELLPPKSSGRDAAPLGAACLHSECGRGPSRTRGAGSCEAKAEAIRHGIARAVALEAAPLADRGPGPSASARDAYRRAGKAETDRQRIRKSSGPGCSAVRWSSSLRRPADTRLSTPNALELADKIARRWLPWAQ